MKYFYTIDDIAKLKGCNKPTAAKWIKKQRECAINKGELPPEYPFGIIPALYVKEDTSDNERVGASYLCVIK